MRTSRSRIEPLVIKVTIIQYLLLLLILPADSNVESSNMASLESGVCLLLFRHRGNLKCSRHRNDTTEACSTYIRTALPLPSELKKPAKYRKKLHPGAFCGRENHGLAPRATAASLPPKPGTCGIAAADPA